MIQTRNSITRFDEIILDKASKISLEQLKFDFKQSYTLIDDFKDLKSYTEKHEDFIKKEFDVMRRLLDDSHDILFEKLSASMDRYAKILNSSFGKPVNAKELKLHLQ